MYTGWIYGAHTLKESRWWLTLRPKGYRVLVVLTAPLGVTSPPRDRQNYKCTVNLLDMIYI